MPPGTPNHHRAAQRFLRVRVDSQRVWSMGPWLGPRHSGSTPTFVALPQVGTPIGDGPAAIWAVGNVLVERGPPRPGDWTRHGRRASFRCRSSVNVSNGSRAPSGPTTS